MRVQGNAFRDRTTLSSSETSHKLVEPSPPSHPHLLVFTHPTPHPHLVHTERDALHEERAHELTRLDLHLVGQLKEGHALIANLTAKGQKMRRVFVS